jgi:hypothetical protein
MAKTTPNKESVRRICLLSGGSFCYLLVDTDNDYVDVLSDLKQEEIENCQKELESWCGMKFRVFSTQKNSTDNFIIKKIQRCGEKLWPIEHNDNTPSS